MGTFYHLHIASLDAFFHSFSIFILVVWLDLHWLHDAWQNGKLHNEIKKHLEDDTFIALSAGLYFSLTCTIGNGIYYYYHKGKRVKTYLKCRLLLLTLTICCYRFKEPKTRTMSSFKSVGIVMTEVFYLFVSCVGATALVEKMEDSSYYKIQSHHMDIVCNPARWRLGGIPLMKLLYFQSVFNLYFPGMQIGYYLKRVGVPELKLGMELDVAYQAILIVTLVISIALALNSITLLVAIKKKSKGILLAYYYLKIATIFPLRFCIVAMIQKEDELTHSPEFPVPGIFVLLLSYVLLFDLAQVLRFYTYLTLRHEMTVQDFRLHCQHNTEYLKGTGSVSYNFFELAKSDKEIQKIVESAKVGNWRVIFDGDKIGEGNFAQVFKGHLRSCNYFSTSSVAIKIMKDEIGPDYFHSIVSELKTLKLVWNHENLVSFLGICQCKDASSDLSLGILTEFCEGGSLLEYLQELRGSREMSQLKKIQTLQTTLKIWALEIAIGMEYLETKRVIHSDLAARNVLLTANLTCKISDFGMSLRLYHYQTYAKSKQSTFPFRSMSPESLMDLKFSTQSDVYSYGVLFWEIFTLGEPPWGDLVWSCEFPKALINGMLLPQPELASKMLYAEMMLKCWEVDPKLRPSFNSIVSYLERKIDRNQILIKKLSKEPCFLEN